MKIIPMSFLLLLAVSFAACSGSQSNTNSAPVGGYDAPMANNDMFDNSPLNDLGELKLFVGGEVADSGYVDFSTLQSYNLLVKETLLPAGGYRQFVGAYKYEGYSLHDILSPFVLKKKNEGDFRPNVDAYVEVENVDGEKVVFSWGEIFYPSRRHNIIIAKRVMRIVPEKSKDQWPLPVEPKVVVKTDLLTERNLTNPVRITVKSYSESFEVRKGLKPCFSPTMKFYNEGELIEELTAYPELSQQRAANTIFYGKGRGIHSTEPRRGIFLKDYLLNHISYKASVIQKGMVVVAAKDGYRAIFSASEIFNRNDQSEVLFSFSTEEKDGGFFRVYPSGDFFSDRAVKGITEIRYSESVY